MFRTSLILPFRGQTNRKIERVNKPLLVVFRGWFAVALAMTKFILIIPKNIVALCCAT